MSIERSVETRIENAILKRRGFLKVMGASGVAAMLPKLAASQSPPETVDQAHFVFTRIEYDKGDWNADMLTMGMLNGSEVNFLHRLNQDTGIYAYQNEYSVRSDSDDLFDNPFLYITGHGEVDLTAKGRDNIKRILENGGFLFADNCSGAKNVGFDRAIRGQLQMMFPDEQLQPIPMTHPLYTSHHRITRLMGGDKRIDPYMEGIDVNGRLAVVYTINDLGCAWEGHPCTPGGEAQRTHAFEVGTNMVYYALSGM